MQRRTLAKAVVMAGGALLGSANVWAQEVPATEQAAPSPTVSQTQLPVPEAQETGVSQVRIVRLSQARGAVQMDRNTGRGFEPAFANIPVVAGAKLRTADGVAEVEFEDNSSLRLAPNSEVTFGRLSRTAEGATETTVTVVRGLVYVALEKSKQNQFSLIDGGARIDVRPGAHLRLNAGSADAELALFDGSAQVQVGSAVTEVGKKQTLTLNPAAQTVAAVEKGTSETDWDEWDKKENGYHKQKASFAGANGFGSYGANDLSYYGSFVDMPGCGSMWRPYFASAAWDPFSNGVWAWYPTAGYSWVSPYPWGWLPFHSGTWASCGNAGWGWRPGNSWYGLSNGVALRPAHHPLPRPLPPAAGRGTATLVPVNTRPLATSGMHENGFAFRQDSAGLGVPRASFGQLHGIASHVERHGMAMTAPPQSSFASAPALSRPMQPGSPASARQVAPGSPVSARQNAPGARSNPSMGSSPAGSRSSSMGAPSMGAVHGGGGGGSMSSGALAGGAHK